ncbi:COQ9 family protein [Hyphomonas sp. WL0036]|uniref:COQ9 family protein n=1 Tax=Hyphomonas sediminis TaxID=2866160 RepID=UPI001C7F44B3|nr:COQ9 family protein [Hyphomonas sediminis]MBY9066401.1 COQ9 family protein [Hyphomonas sediminis]
MTTPPSVLLRRRWLEALLPEVVFEGWSEVAAVAAAEKAGLTEGEKALAAPRGVIDLIDGFFDEAETAAKAALEGEDFEGLRVPEKVKCGVLAWLEALEPHREAVRRAASRGFLPWGAGPALQRSWKVADMVWTAAGDASEDYNRFSKRGLLASVIPAIVLHWADNPSAEDLESFIDRRLSHASGLGRTAGRFVKPFLDRLPQKHA